MLSVDLGRLNKVLDIDAESGLARIQAGTLGPDLEEQLGARGWTMGHFPDSFTHSTLGGWVATRSSGMQSDKYGDIADITRGLRVVVPGDVLVIRAAAEHRHRTQRAGDDPRQRGPARRHHRGHRAGAPGARGADHPGLPVPDLGGRAGRHAGDLDQSDARPDRHPGVRLPRDRVLLRHRQARAAALDLSGRSRRALSPVLRATRLGPGQGLPVVHRLRGRPRATSRTSAELVKDIVGKHGGIVVGTGPGRALRPEEVRHPVPAGLPARPRRRRRRLRDRRPVVAADGGLRQRRSRRRTGPSTRSASRAGSCATCRTATTRAPACTSPSPSRWTTRTRWRGTTW